MNYFLTMKENYKFNKVFTLYYGKPNFKERQLCLKSKPAGCALLL